MTEANLIKERLKKLEEIKKLGINPYPYSYPVKNHIADIKADFSELKKEEKARKKVAIAGRIRAIRHMGRAAFGDIEDITGRIQFYIKQDEDKKQFQLFKLLDIGDIIGIEGIPFRTKTGELSVWTKKLTFLAKAHHPLPDKWAGLKDPELRYRQRYLDLIMNPIVKKRFMQRTEIIKYMRDFLDSRGFIEVETPLLQTVYGGANARPFKTYLNALKMDMFLSISPELYLKRLIIGGLERVYTICKNFRNEGIDRDHNPEFTMMECYQAYADYNDMMKLTEEMIEYIAKKLHGKTKVRFQGRVIDFKVPWRRITMAQAIKKTINLDVRKMSDAQLKKKCMELKLKTGSRDFMINSIFEDQCEKHLLQPTFITDYPKEVCPLTKTHRKDPHLVERFEGFVSGIELANAYSELNDPKDQFERLKRQEEMRKKGDLQANPMDKEFVNALKTGMPPTGGLGIGVDRLVMFLTDAPSIREIIFFPMMKEKP